MTRIYLNRIFGSELGNFMCGVDDVFNEIDALVSTTWNQSKFPPHNLIEVDKENRIYEFALAGFSKEEVSVHFVEHKNHFIVTGEKKGKDVRTGLYRGISNKNFKRVIAVWDHWKVTGAEMSNGILQVILKKEVPEGMRPKSIEIK